MGDYRPHRVSALQPPPGMSSPMQSYSTATQYSTGTLGRTESYSAPYNVHRSSYSSPHSGYSEMSRYPQYTQNPRAVDAPVNSSSSTLYNHPTNMLLDTSTRSSQSVTDAPPFTDTVVLHNIITGNTAINPEIQAKIHKGFFQVDEKWTCYRRNYFAVSCSFSLKPWVPNAPLYLQLPNHTTENIRSFSMSISAVVNTQDSETRELVQHTPKRDKQSERKPGKVTLQPNQPPSLVLSHAAPSHLGFAAPPTSGIYSHPYPSPPQPSQPPTQHTFERIQFQKATANNGKRRAQQQYYNLVVELYAEISNPIGNGVDAHWVKIAKRLSHPMVVRGRSPGHYKDGRRDSSTSMGPDGGAGSSGDGNGGALQGLGHGSRSHLTLMPYGSTHRNGSQYGRTEYRQMASTEHSGSSDSPLVSSSSSSSGFEYTMLGDSINPMETMDDVSGSKGYCDDTYPESSQDMKMEMQPNNPRIQSLKYDYDNSTKSQEDNGARYSSTFGPMIPPLYTNQESQMQYFKRAGSDESLTQSRRQTPAHGYGPVYPREFNEKSYGRLDTVPSFHGLCS
ncbi:hypothetical protein FQN54_002830 [Arachnomyces sp. PD_36]|nr:hypothetical protein FQN54_002830 [Arachnomyces sp. PD_36]